VNRRRRGSVRRATGIALLAGALRSHVALADPSEPGSARPPVSLSLQDGGCDAAQPLEITAALRVELLGRLVEGPPPGNAYRAALVCSGDVVAMSVVAPGGGAKSNRTDLASVPASVRSRILALAVAELVRDLDRDASPAPSPPQSASLPRLPELAAPPTSRPPGHSLELGAFVQTGAFLEHALWLTGGGLRVVYSRGPFWAGFDVALLSATQRFESGTVQDLLTYGSPFLGWQSGGRRMQARLGAGYALGAAKLRGSASDALAVAGSVTGPWAAPHILGDVQLVIAGGVSLYVRGHLGWVTSPVVGQVAGASRVAFEGAWAGGQAGIALAL
jgi:hypothetical protein